MINFPSVTLPFCVTFILVYFNGFNGCGGFGGCGFIPQWVNIKASKYRLALLPSCFAASFNAVITSGARVNVAFFLVSVMIFFFV